MANPVSGTYLRYDAKGLREQLSDAIYDISPMQFPFSTGAGRGPRAKQTLVEWQTDSLAAATTANAHVEGFEADFTTPAATVRVGNYTQIFSKTAIVSMSLEEIDKAGRRREMALQMSKRAKENRRDQEMIFLHNQAGNAGGATTARNLAGLGAWLKTNVDKAGDGTNPTYTAGVPGAARGDGTQRPYTETIHENVMQTGWDNGADFGVLLLGKFNKRVASTFAGIATRNYDLSNVDPRPTAVINSIDVIVDDFGTLRVIPDRFQRDRDGWYIDFEFVTARFLRPYRSVPLAKTGDAIKRMLVGEVTLQVKNEAALGLAADLTTA